MVGVAQMFYVPTRANALKHFNMSIYNFYPCQMFAIEWCLDLEWGAPLWKAPALLTYIVVGVKWHAIQLPGSSIVLAPKIVRA